MKRSCTVLLIALLTFITAQPDVHALQLRVITEDWPPLSYLDNGEPRGMAVEIVEELLNRVRIPAQVHVIPWNLGWELASSEPNVLLFSMVYTEERAKQFKMIGAIAVGATKFYARKGSGITLASIEEAKQGHRISTYHKTYEEQFLKKQRFTNFVSVENPIEAAQKLMEGEVDLWINVEPGTGPILREAGYAPNDVEAVLTVSEELFYIAFSEATPDGTVAVWQEKLNAMKQDGTFEEIYHKWFPGKTLPPEVLKLN
ncbi:extracellular solute-binding protein, family 3 [Candidatus Vecturithrix granuli]|uniref:Extracellular solute-binding protein, family 3 n=1 Tax=Vecturithrix granuli TaxID=1499967 RepID=A0A081C969_VECG1|nr:extracellular solute-binding protein, family 3 [Candidatus Vecturithrix granuli]